MSEEIAGVEYTDASGKVFGIPFDPDNTDYQAYLKWVEQGGVPLPADEQGVA